MPPKTKRIKKEEDSDFEMSSISPAKRPKRSLSRSASVQPPQPPVPQRKSAKNAEKDIKKTAAKEAAPTKGAAAKKLNQGKKANPKSKAAANQVSREVVEIKDDEGKDLPLQNGLAKNIQVPEIPRVVRFKAIFTAHNNFPADPNGDVYIQLGIGASSSVFRLHSEVLLSNSSWFAESLQSKVYELDEDMAARGLAKHGLSHRFEIRLNDPERDLWILVKATCTFYQRQNILAPKLNPRPEKLEEREDLEVQFLRTNFPAKSSKKMQSPCGLDGCMDIDPPNDDSKKLNYESPMGMEFQSASISQENLQGSTNYAEKAQIVETTSSGNSVEPTATIPKQSASKSHNDLLELNADDPFPQEENANTGNQNGVATAEAAIPMASETAKLIAPQQKTEIFVFGKASLQKSPERKVEVIDQFSEHQSIQDIITPSTGIEDSLVSEGQNQNEGVDLSDIDHHIIERLTAFKASPDPGKQVNIPENVMNEQTLLNHIDETDTGVLATGEKYEDAAETFSSGVADLEADVVKMKGVIEEGKEMAVETNNKDPKESNLVPRAEIKVTKVKDEQQEPYKQPSSVAQSEIESNIEPKFEQGFEPLEKQQPKAIQSEIKQPEFNKQPVSTKKPSSNHQLNKTKKIAEEAETIKVEESEPQKIAGRPSAKNAAATKKEQAAKQETKKQTTAEQNVNKAAPKKPGPGKQSAKKAQKSEPIVKEEEDEATAVLASVPLSPPSNFLELKVGKPVKNDEKAEIIPKVDDIELEITGVVSKAIEIIPSPVQAHHPKPAERPQPTELTINGFTNLFRVYYDLDIVISTDNFDDATDQAELLTRFMVVYGVESPEKLKKVNRILCEKLESYGPALFQAIKEDPPRWLYHSLFLRSDVIFKEALIHMVGRYPKFPWTNIPENLLTPFVLCLINRNFEKLQALAATVDISLFELTVEEADGVDVMTRGLRKSIKREAVCLWHRWHTEQILDACYTSRSGTDNSVALRYRFMGQGGHAYLPEEKEWKKIKAAWGDDFTEAEEHDFKSTLLNLKKKAQRIVQPLMRNESRLDPCQYQIEYLTCTKIEDDDLPWVWDDEMRELDPVSPRSQGISGPAKSQKQ